MVLYWKGEGMAVKKFNEVTINVKFYQPTDKTPEKSIDEIMAGIKELGGNPKITGTKLVNDKGE
jgi:hypothetical protein